MFFVRWSLALGLSLAAPTSRAQAPGEPAATSEPAGEPGAPASPSSDEKAHALYLNGERLYNEGRYEEAVVAFQAAYDLSLRPLLLFNIANAYERLGELQRAVDTLNRYRVFADPAEQDVLLARVQTIERRIAQQASAVPVPLPMPAPEPVPEPLLPPIPTEPVPRTKAPWLVAVGGGAVAVLGAGTAGLTWASSRSILERGDEQGWRRLKPLNNAGVITGITGSVVGAAGLTWGVARDQLAPAQP